MYLDNPNQKIRITEGLRNLFITERNKKNFTGSVVAQKMGRQQSWVAQIESGRIQSIKHRDLVMFFSVVLNITPEEADQYLSKNLTEDIFSTEINVKTDISQINNKDTFKEISKYNTFTKNETEEEFKKQKRFIIQALNSMYEEIPEDAVRILRSFCGNLKYKMPFMMGIVSLPFRALEDLDEDVAHEVYTKIAELLMEYANKDKERIKRIEDSQEEDEDEDDWDEDEDEDEED